MLRPAAGARTAMAGTATAILAVGTAGAVVVGRCRRRRQLPEARMNRADRVALPRTVKLARTAWADRVVEGQRPAVAGPAPAGQPDPVRLWRTVQVSWTARPQRALQRRRGLRWQRIGPTGGQKSVATSKSPLRWALLLRAPRSWIRLRRILPGKPAPTESPGWTRAAARLRILLAGPRGLDRTAAADPAAQPSPP